MKTLARTLALVGATVGSLALVGADSASAYPLFGCSSVQHIDNGRTIIGHDCTPGIRMIVHCGTSNIDHYTQYTQADGTITYTCSSGTANLFAYSA